MPLDKIVLKSDKNRAKDLVIIVILITLFIDLMNFRNMYLSDTFGPKTHEEEYQEYKIFFRIEILKFALLLLIPFMRPKPLFEKGVRAVIKEKVRAKRSNTQQGGTN